MAGATGAVGTVFVPRARARGLRVFPHVRPQTAARHPLGQDPDARVFDLAEAAKLDAALAEVEAVVCLVGTTRARFAAGDTYEKSDYQPVIDLLNAAKKKAVPPHFVLLSSYGARRMSGYLGWKWKAEEAVRGSGLPWTIARPSAFDSRGTASAPSDGRMRRPPPLMEGGMRALGALPGLRGLADDLRPISLEVLAAALVRVVIDRGPLGQVLTGRELLPLAG